MVPPIERSIEEQQPAVMMAKSSQTHDGGHNRRCLDHVRDRATKVLHLASRMASIYYWRAVALVGYQWCWMS
jgi:hypothetical protein